MGNNVSPDDAVSMILALQKRLDRIENSPQVGNTSIVAGALQILDPLGRLITALGYQPDGSVGLAAYDPATGTKLAMFGRINLSPLQWGLTVKQGAAMQLVAGAVDDYAAVSVTSTGAVLDTFVDGPSVAVTVGPAGLAEVTIGALISPSVAGVDGDVILMVDGTVLRDSGGNVVLHSVAGAEASVSASAVISGLGPSASHTFSHGYTDFGSRANFQNRFIVVRPL